MNSSTFRPRGLHAACIEAVIEALRRLEPGAVMTYTELSAVAGQRLMGGNYILQRATRELRRDYRIVVKAVHGEGVRRLTDEQIVENGSAGRRSIRRKAARELEKVKAADTANLSHQKQLQLAFIAGVFGALDVALHGARCKAAVEGVQQISDMPSPRRLLDRLMMN